MLGILAHLSFLSFHSFARTTFVWSFPLTLGGAGLVSVLTNSPHSRRSPLSLLLLVLLLPRTFPEVGYVSLSFFFVLLPPLALRFDYLVILRTCSQPLPWTLLSLSFSLSIVVKINSKACMCNLRVWRIVTSTRETFKVLLWPHTNADANSIDYAISCTNIKRKFFSVYIEKNLLS